MPTSCSRAQRRPGSWCSCRDPLRPGPGSVPSGRRRRAACARGGIDGPETTSDDMSDEPDLEAGEFASWIVDMQAALRGERDAEVPCGTCTACCTSSQFVHIAPDETDTLAHIPAQLLFPAPRLPEGHVLLGYDDRGHCPMLIDGRCSIYEHRPRTCRTYDCGVFPAAGIEPLEDEKPLIAERARRW